MRYGIDQHLEIGLQIFSEQNIGRLLDNLLISVKNLAGADSAILYLFNETRAVLQFVSFRTNSISIESGEFSGIFKNVFASNVRLLPVHVAITGKTVCINDIYETSDFDFRAIRRFDEMSGYRTKSILSVPLKNNGDGVIGVIQLTNAMTPKKKSTAFSKRKQEVVESFVAQAAVTITNHELVRQMERLFESFISAINVAIDEKSPYTGRHCQRVPEIAMMLVDAVNETKQGPLAGEFICETSRHELRVASLLHDCGKIATPDYVIDKATKLHTLFDRIHLIDARFDLIRRDAEILMMKKMTCGVPSQQCQNEFAQFLQEVEEDQQFLHEINQAGADTGAQRRIVEIAKKYHWRDKEGMMHEFLSDNEIENLSIRSGTLTAHEKTIVNRHVSTTISILESLPWPEHLKRVPEYAGEHHERIGGGGYPKGISGDEMSICSKILAIADIFEALTAENRPYKPKIDHQEAIGILKKLAGEGHICPDLLQVFNEWMVGERYTRKHLPT